MAEAAAATEFWWVRQRTDGITSRAHHEVGTPHSCAPKALRPQMNSSLVCHDATIFREMLRLVTFRKRRPWSRDLLGNGRGRPMYAYFNAFFC